LFIAACIGLFVPPAPAQEKQSGNVKINPKDGAEMILIPAGAFLMGDEDARFNKPHRLTLPSFYIYKNLVTVRMYETFCKATKRRMPPPPRANYLSPSFNPNWSKKDHPIVNVTWDEAKAYCDWAGVTLPTQAQWEKAARGTRGRKYPWGDTFDPGRLSGVHDGTVPVGRHPSGASPYGVLDMVGNVLQWCADGADPDFLILPKTGVPDPQRENDVAEKNFNVGKPTLRVARGCSWNFYHEDDHVYARTSNFVSYVRTERYADVGFRCVLPVGR
jgi:serine/threonine-protein kinase